MSKKTSSPREPRDRTLRVRVTATDLSLIDELAVVNGQDRSEAVRAAIRSVHRESMARVAR